MRLLDVFKIKTKKASNVNVKKMGPYQLSKIIGGAETLAHELTHVKQESTK